MLVTTAAVLNTNTCEVKNKTPVVSDLVKKADYDGKTLEIDRKYSNTNTDYNKFMSDILDAKIK